MTTYLTMLSNVRWECRHDHAGSAVGDRKLPSITAAIACSLDQPVTGTPAISAISWTSPVFSHGRHGKCLRGRCHHERSEGPFLSADHRHRFGRRLPEAVCKCVVDDRKLDRLGHRIFTSEA